MKEIKIVMPMNELYKELEKKGIEIKETKNEKKEKEYNFVKVNGYIKSESRYIWEKNYGKIPKGMIIHHVNGNKKDNRIENLQLLTFQEHMKIHKKLNVLSIA